MILPPWSYGQRWWHREGPMDVYLRFAVRWMGDDLTNTLDLANVEIAEEERGKGIFSEFLDRLEAAVAASETVDAIYVENLLNDRLEAHLRLMRGYVRVPGTVPACLLWRPAPPAGG